MVAETENVYASIEPSQYLTLRDTGKTDDNTYAELSPPVDASSDIADDSSKKKKKKPLGTFHLKKNTKKMKEQKPISSFDAVPTDLAGLSVDEITDCLTLLNLDQHAAEFKANQIDGVMLKDLDQQILMEDFGMSRFDSRKLNKFVHDGWRPTLNN